MDIVSLDDLCRRYGITTDYGPHAPVPDSTKRQLLAAIGVDPDSPPSDDKPVSDYFPADAPACYCPDWLSAAPAWGIFCQLYELRSARSWGIGDFADLSALAGIAAAAGADFLGINPIHALFLAEPDRRSPFTPSNRRFLNPIYIAMDDLPGKPQANSRVLAALQKAERVEYGQVVAAKISGLRGVYRDAPFAGDRFAESAFADFCNINGQDLENHALFEAVSLHMVALGHGAGWRDWPHAFQVPDHADVNTFARRYRSEVCFHKWLQWIASTQLAAAADSARMAGMRIGIYADLAVGEAPDGSATWSNRDLVLPGFTIGAPPDVFSQDGQNWRLTAPSPVALAARDFTPFRDLIAAQLRYAGALRIDHVMALRQLFLIPDGGSPSQGTHLRYPFAPLAHCLSEESNRACSIIVGEDLGWVPPGFREAMEATRLLSYRILYFEHDDGWFRRTERYPRMALACASTHDLPTLGAWWRGEDLELRKHFGLVDSATAAEHARQRNADRQALVAAFVDGGQLQPGAVDTEADTLPDAALVAAYRFLAATPCLLVGVRLADLVGPEAATNIPGTVDEYPNWQLRSSVEVGQIAETSSFRNVTAALRAARPRDGAS